MKCFILIMMTPLLVLAVEPPTAGTPSADAVKVVPTPDTPEAQAVIGWQKGYKQTLKLKMKDLDVMADFPLNSRHPFQIAGFDNLDNPYKLEVKTIKKSEKTFQVEYAVQRGEKKESGTMVVEKGKLGKIEEKTNDILDPLITFETKITN